MKYFIANWKANKNLPEANNWIDQFLKFNFSKVNSTIIICPPFPLLYPLKVKIASQKNIFLGAQDLSVYESGSYTGEVTAKSLQHLIDYVIVGHSERRRYFNENDKILSRKIDLAVKYSMKTIYCISGIEKNIPVNADFIAFEPIEAIGTGNNIETSRIIDVKNNSNIKGKTYIYGGSVNENNAAAYLKTPEIDGLLISTASLDPVNFYKIVNLI